jgi:hypothetical protein
MDPIVFYVSNYYSEGKDSKVDEFIACLRNAPKDDQNVEIVVGDSQKNPDTKKMADKDEFTRTITGANCIILPVTEDYMNRIHFGGDCCDELKIIKSSEKPFVTIIAPSIDDNDIIERVKSELKLKSERFHLIDLQSPDFGEAVKQLIAKSRGTIGDCPTPRQQSIRPKSPPNQLFFLGIVLLGITVVGAVSAKFLAPSWCFWFDPCDAPIASQDTDRRCLFFEEKFLPPWKADFMRWNDQFGEFSLHWPKQQPIVQHFHKLLQVVTSMSDHGLVLDYDSAEKQFLSSFRPKMTRFDNKIRSFETCYLILLNNVESFQMQTVKYLSYLLTGYMNGRIDSMLLEIGFFRADIVKLREVIEHTVNCSDSLDSEAISILDEVKRNAVIFSRLNDKVKNYSFARKETANELEEQVLFIHIVFPSYS